MECWCFQGPSCAPTAWMDWPGWSRGFVICRWSASGLLSSAPPASRRTTQSGVRNATRHLVRVHGLHRIAFIRGPEDSVDADARYQGYRQALAELGLPFEPRLVASGDFSPDAGKVAVGRLLEGHESMPQAIVAADDATAIGVLVALRDRGISVPGEMAVVGFDDVEEALLPGLSTVSQKLRDQGKEAARILFAELAGTRSEEHVILPTELVIRRSCGCLPLTASPATDELAPMAKHDFRVLLERHSARLAASIGESFLQAADWAEPLLGSLLDDLEGKEANPFLPSLDRALNLSGSSGIEASNWEKVIQCLRTELLPLLPDRAVRGRANALLQQGLQMVESAAKLSQAYEQLRARSRAEAMFAMGQSLLSAANFVELASMLAEGLPKLGVHGCHVSLCQRPTVAARSSRLVLSYDGRACRVAAPEEAAFRTALLVPAGVMAADKPHEVVVSPLAPAGVRPGHIVFELDPGRATLYDELRWQLAAAFERLRFAPELSPVEPDGAPRSGEPPRAQPAGELPNAQPAGEPPEARPVRP